MGERQFRHIINAALIVMRKLAVRAFGWYDIAIRSFQVAFEVSSAMPTKPFQCRDCGSHNGYRSRSRTLAEKYLLPVLLLRPVRCAECFRREYTWLFIQVRVREREAPALPYRAAA